MIDQKTSSAESQKNPLTQPHVVRDIIIVGSPIVMMGTLGNLIGAGTLIGGGIINLGYLFMIVIGSKLLKRQGSGWKEIGLKKPKSWLWTSLLGVAAFVGALVLFVSTQGIVIGLANALGITPSELDQSRFNPIKGNLLLFLLMVFLAWTTIAFGEELFYRAFLLTRMLSFTKMGRWLAILVAGIIFGFVHFAEGPLGIFSNASFGILFGWIFVRSSQNLWLTIIGHGILNTFRFTLLFVGIA